MRENPRLSKAMIITFAAKAKNVKTLIRQSSATWKMLVAIVLCALEACSSADKPKPAELPPNAALLGVSKAWALRMPASVSPMQISVSGNTATVASADGTVIAIDAVTGTEIWRANVGAELLAGVGSDGSVAAVITASNELVALQGGKILWKKRLLSQTYTAPLVAGRRVFIQSADRSMSAWDGETGRRLWAQTRTPDNLVLKKPGLLLAIGDTIITGVGGRMVGVNPSNGNPRWESPIAAPRGISDAERLVDLTGTVARARNSVCARAYSSAVGCIDASNGKLLWTKQAQGSEGLGGDDHSVYGTESNGTVVAWRREDGERTWLSERLKNHVLMSPLAVGRTLVIGESTGTLHFMSCDDGKLLDRVTPDGSSIATAPVLVGDTIVVVTRDGGIFGYRTL